MYVGVVEFDASLASGWDTTFVLFAHVCKTVAWCEPNEVCMPWLDFSEVFCSSMLGPRVSAASFHVQEAEVLLVQEGDVLM